MTPLFALITAGCLCVLGWFDLRARLLPNKWVLAYALLLLPALWLGGQSAIQGLAHLGVGVVAFVVLLLFFILNAMGGGDVKLGAAVFMWAGVGDWLPALLITAWLGGLIAVAGWLLDRPLIEGIRWAPVAALRCALSARRGVPYGVALVAAGLFVLWRHWLGWAA